MPGTHSNGTVGRWINPGHASLLDFLTWEIWPTPTVHSTCLQRRQLFFIYSSS